MSSTACFGFDDLREGISLGTTKTGILFMEILKTILSSKDMQDIKYVSKLFEKRKWYRTYMLKTPLIFVTIIYKI